MDDESDDRRERERLRRSATIYTLGELGHALATPLNVLTGRLDLLDDADDMKEVRAHAAAMRRQVEKLLLALDAARERIPDPSVEPVDLATVVEHIERSLTTEVEVRVDGATRLSVDLDEVVGAAWAMVDHFGGAASLAFEMRAFDERPGRHLAPGAYLCLVATKRETAPEVASEAVWALSGARGHARLTRATVVASPASELVVVFSSMS